MNKLALLFSSIFLMEIPCSFAGNPIKIDFGMADPHAYVFDGKVYLFTTRDADKQAKTFVMPDWHIWSSTDLVNWKHERTIEPTETYMGASVKCWATETVYKNGKYYFYFSNGNKDTGVMVSDRPEGPYIDVLKQPLLPADLTPGKEYDPTVWVDDDGKAYIVFGHYRKDDQQLNYYIAALNEDMISLAEKPRVLEITGGKAVLSGNDKPNLHKYGGIYYLSAGTHYATSTNIYGPYLRRGNSGNDQYGLNSRAHGNYFMWNNQWFNTWCHFHLGKENARFRESYMTYLHYRKNGEMVSDTVLLDKHFANGVGKYSADWDCIEAEWFMAASGESLKQEREDGGFEVANMQNSDYVYYPNISGMREKKQIIFSLTAIGNGVIEIREDSCDGRMIGVCKIQKGNFKEAKALIRPLQDDVNIYLVFKGESFCYLDSFRFE